MIDFMFCVFGINFYIGNVNIKVILFNMELNNTYNEYLSNLRYRNHRLITMIVHCDTQRSTIRDKTTK